MRKTIVMCAGLFFCLFLDTANSFDLPKYALPATINGVTYQHGAIQVSNDGSGQALYYNQTPGQQLYMCYCQCPLPLKPTVYMLYNRWDILFTEATFCVFDSSTTNCTWNIFSNSNLGMGTYKFINGDGGQAYSDMDWVNTDSSLCYQGVPFAPANWNSMQKKVIFVPGFLGSRLYRKNTAGSAGDQLWETVLDDDISYLMPKPDGSFDDANHPVTLDATKPDHGIVDKAMGVLSKYQYLIDFLDSTVGTQNWKAVPWDWRLSLDEAAENLRSEIDQMAAQGSGKVVLITHSTGGLLARAYLTKYGSAKVERFISVAAPHLGTPIAFRELLHGD